jgi:membrane protein DedA with SNARE-associated domain
VAILGLLSSVIVILVDVEFDRLERETSDAFAYFVVFFCVAGDAVIPLLPGETIVNAASVLAAEGKLEIGIVMVASAFGAVIGDNMLYWIARRASRRFEPQIERAESQRNVQAVMQIIGDNAPLFIVFGRYVPGVRFFINASMGVRAYPYRRFLVWSTIGGTTWAVYTSLLAYWVGTSLSGYPVASFLLAGTITTVLIAVIFLVDRSRRRRAESAIVNA